MPEECTSSYKDELHRALEKCQFIEEILKMCLLSAIEIARIQVSPYFLIKYKEMDIHHLPLGHLVSAFSKINDDIELHKELREITKERNKVAHRSLLFTIGELTDEPFMEEEILKMKNIADRATIIHERVMEIRYNFLRTLNKVRRIQAKNSTTNGTTTQ